MWKVRELADKVTNVVMNYTEIESRVREATNDDPWGPTGTVKHELSQATYSYDQFPEVMGMLWKRIAENKRNPRRVYKSLLLLHHLLMHGSDRVVRAAQDRLYEVRALQDYHVVYEPGFNIDTIIGVEPTKDQELNVRVKAKELVDLIQDEDRLRDERKKAKKNRDKYVGIGSDRMMTSKWDNGDFSSSTGGGGGGGFYDDDIGGRRSRSPSPTALGRKPYRDREEDSDFSSMKKSYSSNSFNNNRTKPGSPSPGLEISDDFDPRAEESRGNSNNDFGDFASAVPTTGGNANIKAPGLSRLSGSSASGNNTDSDFADFQSAFGGDSSLPKRPSDTAAAANKPDDLLGLSLGVGGLDLGGTSAPLTSNHVAATNNISSLLSDDLFSAAPASVPPAVPSGPNSPINQFPAFGGVPSVPVMGGGIPPSMTSPVRTPAPAFSPVGGFAQVPVPQSPIMSAQPPLNFGGGNDLLTPVLEPAKPSSNNANNSAAANNNNNPKQTLKGTTWSDLNLSLDDLNLGRNKPNAPAKTPMNQLKTTPTSSGSFGGLL